MGNKLELNEFGQSIRFLVIVSRINNDLLSRVFVDERMNERPDNGKDARRAHDQETAHRLGIIVLDNFDDATHGKETGTPQVTHTQSVQVTNASPRAKKLKIPREK